MNTQRHNELDDLGLSAEMKQSPFDTPPRYFEKLPAAIEEQLHRKPIRLDRTSLLHTFLQQFYFKYLAFGVGLIAICAIVFLPLFFNGNSSQEIILAAEDVEAYYLETELEFTESEVASLVFSLDDIPSELIEEYLEEAFFYGDAFDDSTYETL